MINILQSKISNAANIGHPSSVIGQFFSNQNPKITFLKFIWQQVKIIAKLFNLKPY